jgi:hypothetical protein
VSCTKISLPTCASFNLPIEIGVKELPKAAQVEMDGVMVIE